MGAVEGPAEILEAHVKPMAHNLNSPKMSGLSSYLYLSNAKAYNCYHSEEQV